MTTLSIALPRMRKIPRPPKALVRKAIECLCWAVWTILCAMAILIRHKYWEVILVFLYGRWMIRDYRTLIKMVEAWLDEKPVKTAMTSRLSFYFLVGWTLVGAPWDFLTTYVH